LFEDEELTVGLSTGDEPPPPHPGTRKKKIKTLNHIL
jgi:hypothetical protein